MDIFESELSDIASNKSNVRLIHTKCNALPINYLKFDTYLSPNIPILHEISGILAYLTQNVMH